MAAAAAATVAVLSRLGAGLFHQIHLRAPLRNDDTLYRLAQHQFAILVVSGIPR